MYGNVNYYSISPNSRLRMYFVYKMFSVRKMIDKVIDLVGLSSLWTETGIQTENKYTTESLESEATRDFKNENKREFAILMCINPFLTNTAKYLTHLTYQYYTI